MRNLLLVSMMMMAVTMAQEPKRCCSSKQYTTKALQLGARVEFGLGIPTQGHQTVVYDYDEKKLYSETAEKDIRTNTTSNIKVLQDFSGNKQYITMEDGTCYYQEIKTNMPPPCVSENATYMGEGKLGYGNNALKLQAWEVLDGHLLTKVAFDSESCTPVIYSLFGNIYGMDQLITYYYYDFQPDVIDVDKMTIPEDCKPQPTAVPPWKQEL